MVEAQEKREQADKQQMRWNIWHLAILGRVEKMPSYDDFVLELEKEKTPLTEEEMRADLEQLKREFEFTTQPKNDANLE